MSDDFTLHRLLASRSYRESSDAKISEIRHICSLQPHALTLADPNEGKLPLRMAIESNATDWQIALCIYKCCPDIVKEDPMILHSACSRPLFHSELIQEIIYQYPDLASVRNKEGMLPLQIACQNNPTLVVVKNLVDTYPDSVTHRAGDGSGMNALMLALVWKADLNVVEYLIKSNATESLHQREALMGRLPLHIACHREFPHGIACLIPCMIAKNPSSVCAKDKLGNLPLHIVCSQKLISMDVLHVLLKVYPSAGTEVNHQGLTPLMLACQRSAPWEVILLLSTFYPSTLSIPDPVSGQLPLHVLCEKRKFRYGEGGCILFLQFLKGYPQALHHCDSLGDLPLHTALSSRLPIQIIQEFLNSAPDTLQMTNHQGLLPLYIACQHYEKHPLEDDRNTINEMRQYKGKAMVDDSSDEYLNLVYMLVQSNPEIFASLAKHRLEQQFLMEQWKPAFLCKCKL